MSRSAKVTRFLGEGEFVFALTIGPAEQLEEVRGDALRRKGFGPGEGAIMAIQARLSGATFLIDDVRQTLRLGLIGGGMDAEEAFRLVERNLTPGTLVKAAIVAADVIDALLVGSPDDQPGGDQSGEAEGLPVPIQPGSRTAVTAGPGSTSKAARSGSRRKTSEAPASGN